MRARSAASPGSARVAVEEQRPVGGVEEVDAADRDRADRVAVVGVAEVDEGGAADVLAAALLLVLEGHLQGDLGRGRAGVRVEDAGEPGRRELDQPRRQLGGAGVGEAEHRRVGDPVELVAHGARRCPGGDGRGRCTRARRRRRGSAGRRCRSGRSPRRARSISGSSSTQPCCCVNGCQRWSRSSCAWSTDIGMTDTSPAPGRNRGGAQRDLQSHEQLLRWRNSCACATIIDMQATRSRDRRATLPTSARGAGDRGAAERPAAPRLPLRPRQPAAGDRGDRPLDDPVQGAARARRPRRGGAAAPGRRAGRGASASRSPR